MNGSTRRNAAAIALALATALGAAPARACPSCPASREARAQVLADGFGANLVMAALPFLVILSITFGITGGRDRRKGDGQ